MEEYRQHVRGLARMQAMSASVAAQSTHVALLMAFTTELHLNLLSFRTKVPRWFVRRLSTCYVGNNTLDE